MATLKEMREAYKATKLNELMKVMSDNGEDIGQTASNEFNFPIVLSDGTEDWITIKISIPTGSHDGDGYDGYDLREQFRIKTNQKLAKKQQKHTQSHSKTTSRTSPLTH